MNKPDSYMPMDWPKFWMAVKGWPEVAIIGYQFALTYYWFHNHCKGLRDDSNFLRSVCERSELDWDICCSHIFDNQDFFKQDSNGMWQQKRAKEDWTNVMKGYEKKRDAGALGAKARWHG